MKTSLKKTGPPLKAIRKHCLQCVGECSEDVRTCTDTDCNLWPYRFGTNPNRKDKALSDTEKKVRSKRLPLKT